MNRKSFLKTLGGLIAITFVTPAMTVAKQTMDKMPKPVQKQTVIEQKVLKNFYTETKYASGYILSGVYPNIEYMCSGKTDPVTAQKLRDEGIW